MDLATILTNIERRLTVLGISSDEASRRAGRPDAIRNLKRKVMAGTIKGSMRADTLDALAGALQTTVPDLTQPHKVPPVAVAGLREYLLQQRELLDRQIAELDAAEKGPKKRPKK